MFNLILLLLISGIYFVTYKKNKKNTLFLKITIALLTILEGFRAFSVGNDTGVYLRIFNIANDIKWDFLYVTRFEKGYLILNILLSYITNNARVLLIIVSIFINIGLYYFIKNNSNNYYLSIFMYVCLLFFYSAMNTIRQNIALTIIIIGFCLIRNRKFIPYLLTVAIASLFHFSAIIAIFLYPLYKIKFNKKNIIIILVLFMVVLLSFSRIIKYINTSNLFMYNYSLRDEGYSLANSLYALTYIFMIIFCLLNKEYEGEDNSFMLYTLLASVLINSLAIKMNIFERLADYYSVFSIIYLPNVITAIKNERTKKIFKILFILLMIIYAQTIIINRPEWNSAFDYKMF